MGSTVDGYYLFRRICEYPDAFIDLSAEIDKAAIALVKKISSKLTSLPKARDLYRGLGPDGFRAVIYSMNDSALKTKLSRLDKHNLEQKHADSTWRRNHLQSLAAGEIDPAPDLSSVLKLFKSKFVDLGTVQQVYERCGTSTFKSVMALVTDKQMQALLGRLDNNNPEVRTLSVSGLRSHLAALAARQIEPMAKLGTGKPETERLHSEAMAAVRRRT